MKQGYAAYTTYKDLEDRAAATATSMGAAVSDACEAGGKSARGLYDKAVTTAPVHTPTQPASSTSSSNGWSTFTSWFNPNTPVPSHDARARAGDHAVNTPPAMETDPGHRSGTERRAQSQWEWEAEVAARTAATAAANEMALAMERAERACAAMDDGTSLNVTPSNGETNAGRTSVHAERVYARTHVGPAHVAPTHVSYADLVFDALHHDYTADVHHISNISADECEPEVPAAVNPNGDETPADGTDETPASIPGPECVDVEASEPPRPPPPAPGAPADDESIADDSGPVEVDDGILASDPITEMEELRRKIAALESQGVVGSVGA
jgi:hypothetical protein